MLGVNRPKKLEEFRTGNSNFTQLLCEAVSQSEGCPQIIYSSSIQVELDNDYGITKLEGEEHLKELQLNGGCNLCIFRLPNIFGKWAKPNYNSVVATFCHNIANGLPIDIKNELAEIELCYVDDVIKEFTSILKNETSTDTYMRVKPTYSITVGKLAQKIKLFKVDLQKKN